MSTLPVTRTITIRNEQGLHARPAELFVRLAQKFRSRIELVREGHRVPGNSIMELLTLGAAKGTNLQLEANGEDAQEAVDALAQLVENGFHVEENNQTEKRAQQSTPAE